MCKKISCKVCGKYTWVGCGKHIDECLEGVPDWEKCGNWQKGFAHPCGGVGTLHEFNDAKQAAQECQVINPE